MKNFIKLSVSFIAIALIAISCSGGGDGPSFEPAGEDANDEIGTNADGQLLLSIADERTCGATHPLVGQSLELRASPIYGINGTVTIISDCEIEFTNFSYNGAGPGVSVFGGNNNAFLQGPELSFPIEGRTFDGETFSIFLPEGMTLDEVNSFSIWCFIFDLDFSSVNFSQES